MLINEAVLHILDKNSGNLLLSQAPLQLGDPFLIEYITKLVDKIKKGDPHIGQLAADEPLLGYLADEGISFLEKTQQLADKLFALIAPAEEIGPADYLFFTGTSDTGGTLFGMIRLDYSSKVTHFVDYEGEAVSNTILQNHAILPNATRNRTKRWQRRNKPSSTSLKNRMKSTPQQSSTRCSKKNHLHAKPLSWPSPKSAFQKKSP